MTRIILVPILALLISCKSGPQSETEIGLDSIEAEIEQKEVTEYNSQLAQKNIKTKPLIIF